MDDLLAFVRDGLGDRFEIDGAIGQGGMATVYAGRSRETGDHVAIKVLRPDVASAVGEDRFRREIQVESGLTHPNILPVLDSGSLDGTLYCVMPRMDRSLSDDIREQKQLQLEDVVRIGREVAAGLAEAHDKGVIHRDVKPSNILLDGDRATISDFGICRAVAATDRSTLTQSGITLGTPTYMSPEQGSGATDLDGRSDIYSLGCVLFEILTGEPPFSGSTTQSVIAKHIAEQPPAVHTLRPRVPKWLEETVLACLAKVPADRPQTARDLEHALATEGQGVKYRETRKRSPLTVALGALAIAAIAALIAVWQPWSVLGSELDPNAIVVFPLSDTGQNGAGDGEAVATILGYALDNTEPLRWIDGFDWLSDEQRRDPRLIAAADKRDISREVGAAWYLDGSILREADSVIVVARLVDARRPGRMERAGISVPTAEASLGALAQRAVVELLPSLLAPDRAGDVPSLAGRDLSAVANWLQGEGEYRRSQFEEAYQHYVRAISEDSVLAPAALAGAQAADWTHRLDEALELTRLALRHDSLLAPPKVAFARGLEAYLVGEADTALYWLNQALATDSSWTEVWIGIADTHRQLLPSVARSNDIAEAAIVSAYRTDREFAPAIYGMAERDIRRGDIAAARERLAAYRASNPDGRFLLRLEMAYECVAAEGPDWQSVVNDAPLEVLLSGFGPALWLEHFECTDEALRAVLDSDSAEASHRWGALLALQSQLVAQLRFDDLKVLLENEAYSALPGPYLYLIDRVAGAPVSDEAEAVSQRLAADYPQLSGPDLWLYGLHAIATEDADLVGQIASDYQTRAAESGRRSDELLAGSFDAHALLFEGDTAAAIERLKALRPTGDRAVVPWNPWESLGLERLTLARLMLAGGDYMGADSVASMLEATGPAVYPVFLGEALEIRAQAAEGRGRRTQADSLRQERRALRESR